MLRHKSSRETINSKKKPMSNMEGPRVLINHDGQEIMKIHIINPLESCGVALKIIITKIPKKMKTIWNIYGVLLLPEVELDQLIRTIKEAETETLLLREQKLLKERKRVLLITICLILVKLLGVLNVEAYHKFKPTKMPIDLQVTPDILMITRIQQLEHPKTQSMIYKNPCLIK